MGIFIYVLHYGVAGAAIATGISQMVSTVVYLCYILRKKSVFDFRIKECCFSKEIMSEILKIGIPTLLFQVLTSLSIGMVNNVAKEYGGSALAAMGPLTKIMSMGRLIVFGLVVAIFPSQIMTLFTKGDMEMIRVGSIALRANGLSFILFGFYTVYSFLFLVMGKAAKGWILAAH